MIFCLSSRTLIPNSVIDYSPKCSGGFKNQKDQLNDQQWEWSEEHLCKKGEVINAVDLEMWNDYHRVKKGMTSIKMRCTNGDWLKVINNNRKDIRYCVIYAYLYH